MIGSLYSGISGLKANTSAMAVIGDNIANVATTGFKSSSVSFANIFSSTLSRTGLEIGRGVTLEGINQRWDSGSLENTNSGTDLSVNGTGMFIVSDPTADSVFYTRAGQFEWDKDGYLVTQDGLIVQGYTLAADGSASGLGDLSLPQRHECAECHAKPLLRHKSGQRCRRWRYFYQLDHHLRLAGIRGPVGYRIHAGGHRLGLDRECRSRHGHL